MRVVIRTVLALAFVGLVLPAAAPATPPSQAPFTEGHTFVPPVPVDHRPPSPELIEKWRAAVASSAEPVPGELPPGLRGSAVTAPPGSIGRLRLYEYTNDGVLPNQQFNSCGQAAMATMLTALGRLPEDSTNAVMQSLYNRYSPDIAFGYLGTSFFRVQKALRAHNVNVTWMEGEELLKETLRKGLLAAVMLDVGATRDEGWGSIGGHWTVVYAMDDQKVYLSNWPYDGACTWANFRRGWDTWMTRAFYAAPPWRSHRWFLVPH